MANITISTLDQTPDQHTLKVVVAEDDDSFTEHKVTFQQADYRDLTDGKVAPVEIVRKSFEFLLENEPKESILSEFDLMEIEQYFPKYRTEIRKRL